MELYLYIHEPYIYIWVYMYLCIHIYIYINIYVYIYIYMYIYMCVYVYKYVYLFMYICMYTYPHTYVYIFNRCVEVDRAEWGWVGRLVCRLAAIGTHLFLFIGTVHAINMCLFPHMQTCMHVYMYIYIYCIRCGCTYTNMIIYVRILHMAKSCSFTSWKDLKVPPASDRRLRWRHGELKIIHPYEIICILTQMG